MDEFLKQFGPMIGFGIMAFLIVRNSLPSLSTISSWGRSAVGMLTSRTIAPGQSQSAAVDDDTLDFQALKRLQARAEKRKCPECKQAAATYMAHWFDDNSAGS